MIAWYVVINQEHHVSSRGIHPMGCRKRAARSVRGSWT